MKNLDDIKQRQELLSIAAAYQNQLCLIDIANDYELMLERIAELERQLEEKPTEEIQDIVDSLRKYCGVPPAKQREVANLIEFLVRENGRITRKAERQLAEAEGKVSGSEILCRIYFDIAAAAIGEKEVRRLRDAALGKAEPAEGGEMNTVCPVCGGSGKDDKCNMPPMCLADDLRIADLQRQLAEYEDTMHRIRSWCNAYPLQMFPVPDFALAAKVLKEAGLTLDAVSASNMRHVLKGVKEIIDATIGKAAEGEK